MNDAQRRMENQPGRNEEREERTEKNLRALRFFVADFSINYLKRRATRSKTPFRICRARDSSRASTTRRTIGSVFDPRTCSQASSKIIFTPSRKSIRRSAYSSRTAFKISLILFDGHSSFSLIILYRGKSARRLVTVRPLSASKCRIRAIPTRLSRQKFTRG